MQGGGGRTCPPQKKIVHGRAEIHASFGQNIKNSKKICYVRKNSSMCAKITVYKGKFYWYVGKNICMFAKKFLVWLENFFDVCENYGISRKIFVYVREKCFW